MLKCSILLLLCGTLCIVNAASMRRTNHIVSVEVDKPWHIKFSIPLMGKFEPLTLQAKLRNPREKGEIIVEFMSHKEGDSQVVFKNKNPQRLVAEDVIYADLEYKSGKSSAPQRIAFNYVIKNKQFDVLYLNTEVEYDAEAEAAQAHLDDYAENSTEAEQPTYAAIPPTKPPSITHKPLIASAPAAPAAAAAAAAQPQEIDATCFTEEELRMKEAEKKYLEAQLETALVVGKIGTRLILTGSLPPSKNAADAIRGLVTDKLQLPHLKDSILHARSVGQEILFEVDTPKHKIEILTLARALLQRSPYKIESTDRDIFEISQLARGQNL